MTPPRFVVRPGYGPGGHLLIEFRGDHRADGYPLLLLVLREALAGFDFTSEMLPADDFFYECRFDGGEFDVSDDWGGLFIHAKDDDDRIIETIADALVKTGVFQRVPAG